MSEGESNVGTGKSVIEIFVLIPVLHLIATGLFLIGYYTAFGHRIYVFASASDMFSATLGNVGMNYMTAAIPPVAFILWMRGRTGGWTIIEAALAKPAGVERDRALLHAESERKFVKFMMVLVVVGQAILVTILGLRFGFIPWSFIGFAVTLIYCVLVVWYSNKVLLQSQLMHATNIIGVLLINSFFNGLGTGQLDQRRVYADAAESSVVCSEGAILRSVGENFLVITPKNEHRIVAKDCKLVGAISK